MGLLDRNLCIRVVSAEPENILSKLSLSGVELADVTYIDYLTVEVQIRKKQLGKAQSIIQTNGASCNILRRKGALWKIQSVRKRPVLAVGCMLFLLLSIILPERIFFVQVKGNESLPNRQILAQAENCGIKFATKASKVRSENVKNQLLGNLPQLQWLGITTSGSVATIQVKERSIQSELSEQEDRVASIAAAQDGIITNMTVKKGNPLFQVGQSVKAGDILVSGYTDCGIKLKAEHAEAEIFAYTLRKTHLVSPLPSEVRGDYIRDHICYRLRVGKKVINLCNHSGIPEASCVKMYSEDYWTLPGGFQLPVSVVKVKYLYHETVQPEGNGEDICAWLPEFARKFLRKQMIAGEILEEELHWDISDEGCQLVGDYACHEMIGQVKYEETIEQNAEDN